MINIIRENFNFFSKLTIITAFPFFALVFFGFFLISETESYLRELGAVFIITLISVAVIVLINSFKLKVFLLLFFNFLLSLVVAFKLFFYFTFNGQPTASAIYVIFETNTDEASEFFVSYFNYKMIVIIGVCFLMFFYLFIKLILKSKQFLFLQFNNISSTFKISIVLCVIFFSYCLNRSFSQQSLILTLFHSIKEYKITKAYNKEYLAQPNSKYIEIEAKAEDDLIGVVIIGESTSRWHMQLYGYNRKTNPLLTDMAEELFVFNKVIASDVTTIYAIEKDLTLNTNIEKVENNFSVVQIANAANYETHWISNQQPVGFTESTPTTIASAAKYKQFIATDSYMHNIYDGVLIPKIKKVLNSKGERKIIFVHLMGTHRLYSKRYPKEYDFFSGVNQRTKFKTAYSKLKVNEYDNAILYNDYVVSEIIKQVKVQNKNSFVVYLSDHGDDVFDVSDFVGHHGQKSTSPMYDIPFLAWFSDDYKKNNPRVKYFNRYSERTYNTENFIYSFSDLINVKFKGYNPTKSIFNDTFK